MSVCVLLLNLLSEIYIQPLGRNILKDIPLRQYRYLVQQLCEAIIQSAWFCYQLNSLFFVPVLHLMSAIFYMILFFKYIKLLHGSKIKTK